MKYKINDGSRGQLLDLFKSNLEYSTWTSLHDHSMVKDQIWDRLDNQLIRLRIRLRNRLERYEV